MISTRFVICHLSFVICQSICTPREETVDSLGKERPPTRGLLPVHISNDINKAAGSSRGLGPNVSHTASTSADFPYLFKGLHDGQDSSCNVPLVQKRL